MYIQGLLYTYKVGLVYIALMSDRRIDSLLIEDELRLCAYHVSLSKVFSYLKSINMNDDIEPIAQLVSIT